MRLRLLAAMAIVAGTAALGAANAQVTAARPVSLAEAITLAQRNAPQTIQARGTERANRAAVRAAYGAFLPSINASLGGLRQFTGSGTVTRVNPSGERVTIQGDRWTYSNSLTLSAQLFDYARVPALRAAKADVSAALQNEVVQSYGVMLAVEQQFFAALAARESEDAARTQFAQAREQLDASRRRVIAGAATASDSLRATTQLAAARLALLTAQASARSASAALTRLTGSDAPVTAAASDPTVAAMDTIVPDSGVVTALVERGPLVAQAEANLAAARARRQVARAAYLPTLGASYSRGGTGTDPLYGFGSSPFPYTGQLRFSLNYPLFNQFAREEQVTRATVTENTAAAALRDARLAARQQALQYLDALRLAQQQVVVQTATIAAATEDLRVQRQRYDLGLSTIVDVLTAQTSLNQARAALIGARNSTRLAAAQLEALAGRPLATLTRGAPR